MKRKARANGNMLTDSSLVGGPTYTRDSRNRLTGITTGATASFAYDSTGRRASKTLAGTTTEVQFDGAYPTIERQGGVVTGVNVTGMGTDNFIGRFDGSASPTETYALTDHLGSTVAITDAAGAIVTSYTYEPYGKTSSTGAASTNPHQYTGRENDGTGLYYYRARYYNPTIGRFISEDPIGLAGGPNTYAYVRGNPVSLKDATGLAPGDRFASGCEAAKDFAKYLDTIPDADIFEYAAGIGYDERTRTYEYSHLITSGSRSTVSGNGNWISGRALRQIGDVHSHTAAGVHEFRRLGITGEEFSEWDFSGYQRDLVLEGYLVTPTGKIRRKLLGSPSIIVHVLGKGKANDEYF